MILRMFSSAKPPRRIPLAVGRVGRTTAGRALARPAGGWSRPQVFSAAGVRSLLVGGLLWAWSGSAVLGQTTNSATFAITIQPTNGTILVSGRTYPVFVTITNFDLFTNVTVVGNWSTQMNLKFLDGGAPPDKKAGDGTFSANIVAPVVTTVVTQTLRLVLTGDEIPPDPPPDPPAPTLVVTNTVDYVIVPPPGNDIFTNAYKIAAAGATVVASNNWAALEPGEPQHGQVGTVDASVWWLWYPLVTTDVLIDLGGSDFDAVLGVYTGTSVSNLVTVASATNDAPRKLKAHVNFNAKAGTTYRIAVAGYTPQAQGNLRLRVAPGALPDTNGPVVSIVSPPSQSTVTSSQISVTGTAKERGDNESGIERVMLQVNNGTNILASGTTDWSAVVDLPPGQNLVKAFAYDYDGNKGPIFGIVLTYLDPPNDLFANAVTLTGVGSTVNANTDHATKEPGEPLHAGNEGGHSIWYRWQAPFSGDLFLSTDGSTFDTVLALYIGNSVDSLLPVASNDDAFDGSGYSELFQRVAANQIYYIAVDGVGGASGDVTLSYSFNSTETLYSLSVVSPVLGGTVVPPSDLYPGDTIVSLWAYPEKNFSFVRWTDPSGNLVSTANPLVLTMTRNYTVQAEFRLMKYTDTFKTGDLTALPWTTAGAAPWSVQSVGGQYAARSGPVANGQWSSLILVTNLYAGTGSFDLSVSSEAGFDALEFYLNGERLGRWSGEVSWQTFRFAVAAGGNQLEWRYVKDANGSVGQDAAFVDNVYIPLEKPNPPATRPVLSLVMLTNGLPQVSVQVQAGSTYVLQATPDFRQWVPLTTNQPTGPVFQWIDRDARAYTQRVYRVLTP